MKDILKDFILNIICIAAIITVGMIALVIVGICYRTLGSFFGTLFLIVICAIIATIKENDPFDPYKKFKEKKKNDNK